MEKYPLLTEMGVTAITNTAYQLTNKNTYDPYDLLKAENVKQFLSKDKKLWQQAYLNAGLNVLSTKDPNDYGWSALAGVTGTVASKMAGNTKNISIIRNTSPVISGVASEYYGDSDRLKSGIKERRKSMRNSFLVRALRLFLVIYIVLLFRDIFFMGYAYIRFQEILLG